MRLRTGATRDGVYKIVNKGTACIADCWRCVQRWHIPNTCLWWKHIHTVYLGKQKEHKELEYTNSHCSKESIKKNKQCSWTAFCHPLCCLLVILSKIFTSYIQMCSPHSFGYNKLLKLSVWNVNMRQASYIVWNCCRPGSKSWFSTSNVFAPLCA